MSFFDEFNNIVPYSIIVNVGKNRPFILEPNQISPANYKGKMVEFYKKAETLEELEKHGLGKYTTYLPAEQISMPIDIKVSSEEKLTPYFENTSKYTNKEITRHNIRLFNSAQAQVGYISITLTPSGDVNEKTSFYESPDGAETVMHTLYNELIDGKFIKDENFEFQKNSEKETKSVKISQRDGKVVGSSIIEKEAETGEDVLYQSTTQFSNDEKTPKFKKYVASCVVDEPERTKRGGTLIPCECKTLEADLFQYQATLEDFNETAEELKQKTGEEITIERVLENSKLSYKEKQQNGIKYPSSFDDRYYEYKARYLADDNNNLLKDFKGTYIGNILRLTDKGYEACIVTKHQKSDNNYRLYTLIDFSGTSITQGTGMDEYMDIDRDPNYFERLKNADKTPVFVTEIDPNGNEKLVLYKGNAISGECPEYETFVENFISPFSEIKPIQIGKFLNKEKNHR